MQQQFQQMQMMMAAQVPAEYPTDPSLAPESYEIHSTAEGMDDDEDEFGDLADYGAGLNGNEEHECSACGRLCMTTGGLLRCDCGNEEFV